MTDEETQTIYALCETAGLRAAMLTNCIRIYGFKSGPETRDCDGYESARSFLIGYNTRGAEPCGYDNCRDDKFINRPVPEPDSHPLTEDDYLTCIRVLARMIAGA